ncbi:MAG TPA: hypothetical protein VJ891_03730, partial [Casimicrobiaceae bacterium]|nr:hypothetical protein [Casimicrobiaceae bacterium]
MDATKSFPGGMILRQLPHAQRRQHGATKLQVRRPHAAIRAANRPFRRMSCSGCLPATSGVCMMRSSLMSPFMPRARAFIGSVAFLAGMAPAAFAQQSQAEGGAPIRIDVTGSNIPRPETESALPVQVLTRDDIV